MSVLLRELKLTLLFVFFLTTSTYSVCAQQNTFIPAGEDSAVLKKMYADYEKHYLQGLNAFSFKNKKDYEEVYKQRWSNIKEKFDDAEIYTSPYAQQYLDAITDEIVRLNPALKDKTFKCYFSRSGVPNASYIGEGIILINMGLFERLENESQVAFVISHEIAHFILKHSENSIEKYVATINSEEVQSELKKIKKTEFKKREHIESLIKGMAFDTRRHGRDHESEADSMAVSLVHNTRFKVDGAISTLNILDSIDTDTLNTADALEKIFNSPNYPFQKKWISKEEGLLGGHAVLKKDKALDDSLKTHPDCKVRIKIIEPLVSNYAFEGVLENYIDSLKFYNLRNIFKYEIAEYAYAAKNYTRCLYYTLELLQQHPGDAYLVAQIGKILNGFYTAQKNHSLGKIIDLPSPSYSSNYNLLLQFVQNLYLENYASLSYHFLNQYSPAFDNYLPFKNAYNTSIQIAKQ